MPDHMTWAILDWPLSDDRLLFAALEVYICTEVSAINLNTRRRYHKAPMHVTEPMCCNNHVYKTKLNSLKLFCSDYEIFLEVV